jgi:hypothetical protein
MQPLMLEDDRSKLICQNFVEHCSEGKSLVFRNYAMHPSMPARVTNFLSLESQKSNECVICFQKFVFGNQIAQMTCCKNPYHVECLLKQWRANKKCPIRCDPKKRIH